MRHKAYFYLIILFATLMDTISKCLAVRDLPFLTPVKIFPGLNLYLTDNTGAAFSFLNGGGWEKVFLILIALGLIGFLVFRLHRAKSKLESIALCLIIGGALGNVLNRLVTGSVIDFIDLYVGHYHWPTFNIGDSMIVVGVGLFLVSGRGACI